jgi:hypothetical protein
VNYLFKKSIEILEKYRSPSGAFIASPNFKVYKYCWFKGSIDLTTRYLSLLWAHFCYDCWEEYGDKIHN